MLLILGVLLVTLTSIIVLESIGAQPKMKGYCAIECRRLVSGKYKFCC